MQRHIHICHPFYRHLVVFVIGFNIGALLHLRLWTLINEAISFSDIENLNAKNLIQIYSLFIFPLATGLLLFSVSIAAMVLIRSMQDSRGKEKKRDL